MFNNTEEHETRKVYTEIKKIPFILFYSLQVLIEQKRLINYA